MQFYQPLRMVDPFECILLQNMAIHLFIKLIEVKTGCQVQLFVKGKHMKLIEMRRVRRRHAAVKAGKR